MFNKIVLMGRLVKDCEVKYTNSGKVVCQFTMAVDRPVANGQKETDFIPVVVWGKSAEVAGNSLQKGHRVLVEGRLQIRSYDAKDGSKRYVTEVIANSFTFIEKKGEQAESPKLEAITQAESTGFEEMGQAVSFDEEIPF